MADELNDKIIEKSKELDYKSLKSLLSKPRMIAAIKMKLENEIIPKVWLKTLYFGSGLKPGKLHKAPLVMTLGFILRRSILIISVFLVSFPSSLFMCLLLSLLALLYKLSSKPYSSIAYASQAYFNETLFYLIIILIIIGTSIRSKWCVSWAIIVFVCVNYVFILIAWVQAMSLCYKKLLNRIKQMKKTKKKKKKMPKKTAVVTPTPNPASVSNSEEYD